MNLVTWSCGICGGCITGSHADFAGHMQAFHGISVAEPKEFITREMLEEAVTSANARADLAERRERELTAQRDSARRFAELWKQAATERRKMWSDAIDRGCRDRDFWMAQARGQVVVAATDSAEPRAGQPPQTEVPCTTD